MLIRVGIIGLGTIGNYLIEKIQDHNDFSITAVWDILNERYEEFASGFDSPPPLRKVEDFPIETDVFVECASSKAVENIVVEAFKRGKAVIVASIAGLMDNPKLWEIIENQDGRLILPSGAIGGLDIFKALDKDDIESVELETRKHPHSLPSLNFPSGMDEMEVYNGPAREAIRKYPQNVNVAALLSLAGIGFDRTRVRLVADSKLKHNVHRVQIISGSGNYRITCENFPFERNPATSQLAAQSIWATLKSLSEKVVYGL
jgi:aspartate dehydrogenase